MVKKTVIVDNGAYSIKLGLSTHPQALPRCATKSCCSFIIIRFSRMGTHSNLLALRSVLNAVVRSKGDKAIYVGDEIQSCGDFASLHFRLPFEKVCRDWKRWWLVMGLEFSVYIGISCWLGCWESHLGSGIQPNIDWGKPVYDHLSVGSTITLQRRLSPLSTPSC